MMRGEAAIDSWFFGSFWRASRKNGPRSEKSVIGILAFEVAGLMSKIVNLWGSLNDAQIARLREEVLNSPGIKKIVSDDDDLLMYLALTELIEDLRYVMQSMTRLAKKCVDPVYHRLEQFFENPFENSVEWCGWEYKGKKMEKKVKKMERYVAVTSQLCQEMEVLVELEQTLRRMQISLDTNRVKLLEFQQKVMWQRQEVKNLREMSPWSRTYDYIVRLMVRAVFTIIERLKVVFGINQLTFIEENNISDDYRTSNSLSRSRSFMQTSVYPSDNPASIFYSAPLVRSSSKLRLPNRSYRSIKKHQRIPNRPSKWFAQSGPFKGCMMGETDTPVLESSIPSNKTGTSIFGSLSCTLGNAALSLHYANIVILIEKLSSAPHLIGSDARDDLYNMLTTSIRTELRSRLKLYAKSLASSVYDPVLASDWTIAMTMILDWISPLAHNTVRWHSERNFEKQHVGDARGCVLLVQTLYFANQSKTEGAIIELLTGLNYLCRFGKEINANALVGPGFNGAYDDHSIARDIVVNA